MTLIRNDLTAPSTTITAAALAAMGATLLTEIVLQLGVELRPTLAASLVTFVSAAVGYVVNERRYGWGGETSDEHEQGGP